MSATVNPLEFAQIEGNFIVYKEVLEGVLPEVIAAFSVAGGCSLGEPTDRYRYRLGGPNILRGYNVNRFRGDDYYLQQTELWCPLWKLFGGAACVGFGDAGDNQFTNPKLAYGVWRMAYGVGLRIGLPPYRTS